jgi:hypothetical protein
LNHHLNSILLLNEYKNQNVPVGTRVTHARVQSVLSLALLYWSRVSTKTDSCIIGGHKTIYIANDSLLRRLRDAYADYDDFTLADDAERYFRGMLWAL